MAETDLPRILAITAKLEFVRTEREYRLTASRQAGSARLTWVLGPDERACAFCRYMEGKVVRSDDPRIDRLIPAHINCACMWVEIGDREGGKQDWLDWDEEEFQELLDTHAHFHGSRKYEALRVPASPSGRDFVFRRGKAGEPGTREWKRPRYEERDDLVEAGVEEKGERWRPLGSDDPGVGPSTPPAPRGPVGPDGGSERFAGRTMTLREGGPTPGRLEPLPPGEPAPPEDLPPAVERALRVYNAVLLGTEDEETAFAVRLDGSKIPVDVRRGRSELQLVVPVEGLKGAIVTHNHPGPAGLYDPTSVGTSFSEQDFRDACLHGLHELQAVTPRGDLHRLQAPPGGWPDAERVEEVLGAYEATAAAVEAAHPEWGGREISHEVARRVAARLGARYTRLVGAIG